MKHKKLIKSESIASENLYIQLYTYIHTYSVNGYLS